jgi:hypothetical protein
MRRSDMNPLISILQLLLENQSIPHSKWPKREIEFLERQVMLGSLRVEELPNGRRILIENLERLKMEVASKFPTFGTGNRAYTRHEAVLAVRDAHLSSATYPALGIRRLRKSGKIHFEETEINLMQGTRSYLNLVENELASWSIMGKVVLIENLEPFIYAEIAHKDFDFALYYSGYLSANVVHWMSTQNVEVLVAPDYDPVGLTQFEKIRKVINSKLWIPDDIGLKFERFHKKETLSKQNNRSILLTLLQSIELDPQTQEVLELISLHQGGLDQEVFYPVQNGRLT